MEKEPSTTFRIRWNAFCHFTTMIVSVFAVFIGSAFLTYRIVRWLSETIWKQEPSSLIVPLTIFPVTAGLVWLTLRIFKKVPLVCPNCSGKAYLSDAEERREYICSACGQEFGTFEWNARRSLKKTGKILLIATLGPVLLFLFVVLFGIGGPVIFLMFFGIYVVLGPLLQILVRVVPQPAKENRPTPWPQFFGYAYTYVVGTGAVLALFRFIIRVPMLFGRGIGDQDSFVFHFFWDVLFGVCGLVFAFASFSQEGGGRFGRILASFGQTARRTAHDVFVINDSGEEKAKGLLRKNCLFGSAAPLALAMISAALIVLGVRQLRPPARDAAPPTAEQQASAEKSRRVNRLCNDPGGPAEAFSLVLPFIDDADAWVRYEAWMCLGRLRATTPEAMEFYRARLANDQLPYHVLHIVEQIGPETKVFLPEFVGMIRRGETDLLRSRMVINLLASLGSEAKDAVPAMLSLWQKHLAGKKSDLEKDVRYSVVRALISILGPSKPVVPHLVHMLKNEQWNMNLSTDLVMREKIIRALGQVGPWAGHAVPQLISELNRSQWWSEKGLICETLGKIGPAARPALPQLANLAKSVEQAQTAINLITAAD